MDNPQKPITKLDNKIEVSPTNTISNDISKVIHDVVSQLTFLAGASLLLVIVYLRKKIVGIVLSEGEKDYRREKDLYYNLVTLLSFTKSDRVLIYEFDSKHTLIKTPILQVRSAGISEYIRNYEDNETEDLTEFFYLIEHSENQTIKSIVSEIKHEYVRADLMNNGVNYLITKLLTFDGEKIGILAIHYCKNGKEYFTAVELPNNEMNLILLLNSLTKKRNTLLNTLFSVFK